MSPFITQERREQLDNFEADMFPIGPGDRCYLYYKEMVRKWKENPRWSTTHELYKELRKAMLEQKFEEFPTDDYTAMELAWQCFFYFYVLPYEEEKEEMNGTI